ncbi:hypothetical protein HMI56_002403, partial [Coelomomyces lativittatus]
MISNANLSENTTTTTNKNNEKTNSTNNSTSPPRPPSSTPLNKISSPLLPSQPSTLSHHPLQLLPISQNARTNTITRRESTNIIFTSNIMQTPSDTALPNNPALIHFANLAKNSRSRWRSKEHASTKGSKEVNSSSPTTSSLESSSGLDPPSTSSTSPSNTFNHELKGTPAPTSRPFAMKDNPLPDLMESSSSEEKIFNPSSKEKGSERALKLWKLVQTFI